MTGRAPVTGGGSGDPFLGGEAVSAGLMSRHDLRAAHRRVFPRVYSHSTTAPDPDVLVRAAALWAPPGSVVCGLAAARLHGERWYSPEALLREVEVYTRAPTHAPPGIRTRRLRKALPGDQVVIVSGIAVTGVARTADDVARWDDDDERAIAKVDAVCNRSRTDVSEVRALASGLRGLHGLARVRSLLSSCDHRADSPPETRLRLLLNRSELPRAVPQLAIHNEYGVVVTVADFGFPDQRVAVFYDGEVHRRRTNWESDARVNAELAESGWQVIRVTAQMLRSHLTVVRQISAAIDRGRAAP